MPNLVALLELIGTFAVCLAFVVLIPAVANILISLFSMVVSEQVAAKLQGRTAHTDMHLDEP